VHDRCNNIFEDISCKLRHGKEPQRHYFDGPKVLPVDCHTDINFEIKSQSWESDEPKQTLSPTSFWSSWFGNESTVEFDIYLKPKYQKR
jgi:hypothetical protein